MDSYKPTSVIKKIRQSPPLDFSKPYDASWVKDKVILITGGASGFGAGFVRKWASNGATVIVGDINVKNGMATCRDINKDVGGEKVHFVHCDVTDWQSQVDLFKEAVKLSPHGGLDCRSNSPNTRRDRDTNGYKASSQTPASQATTPSSRPKTSPFPPLHHQT
jgi:hypothetical protein